MKMVKRKSTRHKNVNKVYLLREYIKNERSISDIARENKTVYSAILYRLKLYNIKTRNELKQRKLDYKHQRKKANYLPKNISRNPKFFYIIGAINGDGHINYKKGCITMNLTDIDFIYYIYSIFRKLIPEWNLKIKPYTEAKGNSKAQFRLNIYSRDFVNHYSNFKPRTLEDKRWYLKGMFDAEGTIFYKDKPFRREITITQGSIRELNKIRIYLKDLNIESRFVYGNKKRNSLRIKQGVSIKNFANLIGFVIQRKQEKLNHVLVRLRYNNMGYKEINTIIKLYKRTKLSANRIGVLLNRSKSSILEQLKKNNIPIIRKQRYDGFNNKELNEINRMMIPILNNLKKHKI